MNPIEFWKLVKTHWPELYYLGVFLLVSCLIAIVYEWEVENN